MSPLIGKWFHSIAVKEPCGCRIVEMQGQVLGEIDGHHLVQLYEWFSGCKSDQRLVKVSEMVEWNFYDTNEEMLEAYETYCVRDAWSRHRVHQGAEAS